VTQTIAIVNEKGGTGKTTTAVNLSAALGELGKKVLLVDLDGQAASSRWLGVEDDTSFADALWAGEAFAPIPEVMPGVALAPGSGKLDSVAHDLRPTQGGQLRKVLQLLPGFDYVIIDCPPSLGNRLIGNALLAATHAIVPVEASILALDGLRILLTTFQDVREGFGHDIVLRGVLTCRYDARTRLSRLVLAELNRALPGRVFRTVIRENVRVRECPGSGKSILAYAPDCHAAQDYRLLAKEMLAAPAEQTASANGEATGLESELTEEERQAVADLRGQVNALFRAQEARASAPAAQAGHAASETAAATPQTAEAAPSPLQEVQVARRAATGAPAPDPEAHEGRRALGAGNLQTC
jgi:chromosome partitioning protein